MRSIISSAIGWAVLALCATAPAAENLRIYRPPRLPDGHADMQGMWKNSNLTPLERAPGFTQLIITAADAVRLQAAFVDPPGGMNVPDNPGQELCPSVQSIRGVFRISLLIDPDHGILPRQALYQDTTAG